MNALFSVNLDKFKLSKEDFISLKNISIRYLVIHKRVFAAHINGSIELNEIKSNLSKIFTAPCYEDTNFLVYDIYKLN